MKRKASAPLPVGMRTALRVVLGGRVGFLEGEDVKVHCQVTEKRRQG